MKKKVCLLIVLILSMVATFKCTAVQSGDNTIKNDQSKTVKILAIGNSFSRNATRFLEDIAKASGNCKLVFGHAMIGGCPLSKHYNLAVDHEENPESMKGKPYKVGIQRLSLQEMLVSEKWDIVTIQQLSKRSFKPETYRPYAKKLYAYIKKYAPQAEVVFHQTWAYRKDDPLFQKDFTQAQMYQELTKAYHAIAKEVGIKKVIPVGDAFQLASESPEGQFKKDKSFDYKNPVYPKLPDQANSLNVGYIWVKNRKQPGEKYQLRYDGHHANIAGEFLGACVWFEYFFGRDVTKNCFRHKKLSEKETKFLRSIAHKIVTDKVKPQAWPFSKEK